MNHPVLDASPSIDAILGGRFIRSCQPETILLLGLGTNEPQVNQPILWGVRGAESNISNPPKLGQKVRKKCIYLHVFFRSPLAVHDWTGPNVRSKRIYLHAFFSFTLSVHEWTSQKFIFLHILSQFFRLHRLNSRMNLHRGFWAFYPVFRSGCFWGYSY